MKVLGYTKAQIEREKALQTLGTTEAEILDNRATRLSELGKQYSENSLGHSSNALFIFFSSGVTPSFLFNTCSYIPKGSILNYCNFLKNSSLFY